MVAAPVAVEARGRLQRVDHEAVAWTAAEERDFVVAGAARWGIAHLERANCRLEGFEEWGDCCGFANLLAPRYFGLGVGFGLQPLGFLFQRGAWIGVG